MTSGRKRRILVIDDEVIICRVLSRHLGARGFDVVCEEDGQGGLDRLKTEPADLVILDNNMPGMMGLVALPKIRALTQAPIIMITGYPNEDTFTDAVLLGAATMFPKPLDMAAVEAKIAELLSD